MSRDEIAEALALTRKVAAGRMVRKEELEAELLRLRGQRQSLDGVAGAEAGELGAELEARIAERTGELATCEAELRAALEEVASLTKLGRDAPIAAAKAVIAAARARDPEDPERTLEEAALDRVREHAAELQAEVRVGEELRGDSGDQSPATPAPKPSSKDTDADADAAARAEFEALRNRPKKTL